MECAWNRVVLLIKPRLIAPVLTRETPTRSDREHVFRTGQFEKDGTSFSHGWFLAHVVGEREPWISESLDANVIEYFLIEHRCWRFWRCCLTRQEDRRGNPNNPIADVLSSRPRINNKFRLVK